MLILTSSLLLAQKASLRGKVKEQSTQQALEGASLLIKSLQKGCSTDLLGNFLLADLPSGNYELEISYIGFATQKLTVVLAENESKEVDFLLKEEQLSISEITVYSGDPLGINTVNAVDINLRPVNSSQDVLRVVPGLFIAQHAGGGKAEQIFLRGFDIDHGTDIHLTVDGLPVNMPSHAHGQGYADLHFVIPETIEKVVFEKGPYYAHKGNLATAGFVEFRTKDVLDKSQFKLEGGQFNTFRGVGMIDVLGKAAKTKGQNLYVAGEYMFTDGYFDNPQNFHRFNGVVKLSQRLGKNTSLNGMASHFRSRWDASGQIPQRSVDDGSIAFFGAIDPTEGGETHRSNLSLKVDQVFKNGAVLSNQVFYTHYFFELYSNFTFFLNDPVNGDQIRQKEKRDIFGYNASYSKSKQLGRLNISSEAGLTFRQDEVKDIELTRTISRNTDNETPALGKVSESNAGIYLDETLRFNDEFSLQAGLRYDFFRFAYTNFLDQENAQEAVTKGIFSPKLNLTYDLSPAFRLFTKSGLGFHSNDSRVVITQRGREILPRALGWEVGSVFKPMHKLIVHAAYWWLKLEQEFVYVGDEGIVEPGGKTLRMGVDLSFRYQLTDWLFADMDFNFTRPRSLNVPEGENHIPLAPTVTSIGGLSFQFKNGLNGSLRYRYLADRPANEDNSLNAEGYFLVDALLNYTKKRYQVGLSVENVWDKRWKEAQFATESRLRDEVEPVSEIHFTPGSPFFLKGSFSIFF